MNENKFDEMENDQKLEEQEMPMSTEELPEVPETSEEPEEEEKKSHTKRNIAIVVGVIIVILLLLLGLRSCSGPADDAGDTGTHKPTFSTDVDEGADDPLKGLTDEEIREILNEKVEMGMINISMNTDPVFADGKSVGNLGIMNETINNYPQVVEIFLRGTEDKVYESKLIPVGKEVRDAKLDVELEKGDYPCTAFFHNIDPDTGESLGKAGAEITLHILA